MARYPNFRKLLWNQDLRLGMSGFCGAYKGNNDGGATPSAANYWWGGGSPPGTNLFVPINDSDTNATQFGFRWKILSRDLLTKGHYIQNIGSAAEEQARFDFWASLWAELGLTFINPFYYIRLADFPDRNGDPQSRVIWDWFTDNYFTSSQKNRFKWVLTIVSRYASFDSTSATFVPVAVGSWNNLPNQAAYWASLALDPQYLRADNGRPIVYTYNDTNAWDAGHLATVTAAFVAAGLPVPYYINGNVIATAVDGVFAYGPNSGALPSVGQNPYKARMDNDIAIDAVHGGVARQWGFQLMDDSRPINGNRWTDTATYTQHEQHLQRRMIYARALRNLGDNFKAAYGYALLEDAEGGSVMPCVGYAGLGPSGDFRGPRLEALKNVKRGILLASYPDHYHADAVHADITRPSGTWTTTTNINGGGGSNPAPYEFKVHKSSTAGAQWRIAPAKKHTRVRIYGPNAASAGQSNWTTDGGGGTAVNQNAGGTTYGVLLYDTGVLAAGNHVVLGTQTAGEVQLERVRVDVAR